MVALAQLALYYGVEEQLETQIEANLARLRAEGME